MSEPHKALPLQERIQECVEAVLDGRYSAYQAAFRWNVPVPLINKMVKETGKTPRQSQGIGIIIDPIPFAVPKVTESSEIDRIGQEVASELPTIDLDLMTEAGLPELERLQRQYDRCLRMVRASMQSGNGNAVYKHEYNLHLVGKSLDAARSKTAEEEARRKASEVRDPIVLAGQLLNHLDKLVMLAPEEARAAYERLKVVFGPA